METFSALLAICVGNSPVSGEFPTQWSVTRSFDVFFDLCPNERLSKHSGGWWFETLSCPLWRHSNGRPIFHLDISHLLDACSVCCCTLQNGKHIKLIQIYICINMKIIWYLCTIIVVIKISTNLLKLHLIDYWPWNKPYFARSMAQFCKISYTVNFTAWHCAYLVSVLTKLRV